MSNPNAPHRNTAPVPEKESSTTAPADAVRGREPDRGEAAHHQRRPRAPQLGLDRRGPRDADAGKPASPKPAMEKPERRKAPRDRRQSWS